MLTPQTNTTLEAIAETLLGGDGFIVCGHIHPDGDCIGSTLGLTWALRMLGKDATPLIASGDDVDETLAFLPLADDAVPAHDLLENGSFDGKTFIAVDTPNDDRLGHDASEIRKACARSIVIDHHAYDTRMGDMNYTEPDAASTTVIIWELCKHLGFYMTHDDVSPLASCLYTGILTDSNCFTNKNVDSLTFSCASEMAEAGADPSRIAACLFQRRRHAALVMDAKAVENSVVRTAPNGTSYMVSKLSKAEIDGAHAKYDDLDNCVNVLRSQDGIDVVCLLKEGDNAIRGSFRAKDSTDVAKLASRLGGGGHSAAAGFTLECPLDEAFDTVCGLLDNTLVP